MTRAKKMLKVTIYGEQDRNRLTNMKYQVLLLGSPWREDDVKNSLKDVSDVIILNHINDIDDSFPFLCLYFGNSEADAAISDDIASKLNKFIMRKNVLPVARKEDDFKTKFPENVKSLNGFFLDDTECALSSLRNFIISFFGLMDGTRKVFISYHRDETRELAVKLYDLLIKDKYRPFLDSYSIESGVDFQESLRHELINSDILVMLDTPGFNSSKYCMEEFNIANEEGIPVLDIRFNVDAKKNMHRFCDYIETGMDSVMACQDEDLPLKIITLMEKSRAKAFCIKRKFIVDEFLKRCQDYDLPIKEQGGYFRCDITHECFFPMTHYPDIDDLYRTKEMSEKTPLFSTYSKQVLFNGNYCKREILDRLYWCNEYLPIKTYNVNK